MECTIFLRNWHNIVLKSISAVSLLDFINEGSNEEKGIHKMRESYDSLTHWAQIKAEGHVVVPILRGKSNLCCNWPITWTECTLRLKIWPNKVFKSLTLLLMARIRRSGHTKGENLISPFPSVHRAKINVAKLLAQFQGKAAYSSNLDFKWKVDECKWNLGLRCLFFGNYRNSELTMR
jgi:hypothetical protein